MADNAQPVVSGATTAPNSGVSGATPAPQSASTSATTKNTVTGAQRGAQPQQTQADVYGDDWWKEHQEGIFKHPRFKELSEYKNKYSQAEPLVQFAEQMGGFDNVQSLYQYFGPVYAKLMELAAQNPQQAQQLWGNLLPHLNAVLTGQQVQNAAQPQMQEPEMVDESNDDPRIKMLLSEIEQLKQRDQMRTRSEVMQHQQKNFDSYVGVFNQKVAELQIPQELADLLHNSVANSISKYMPKDPRTGQQIKALDVFSKEAFDRCWEKEIEPKYKAITGWVLSKTKTTTEQGGPVIPDTTLHGKPAANMTKGIRPMSQRVAAMQSVINNMRR